MGMDLTPGPSPLRRGAGGEVNGASAEPGNAACAVLQCTTNAVGADLGVCPHCKPMGLTVARPVGSGGTQACRMPHTAVIRQQ